MAIVVGAAEDAETHTVHKSILEKHADFWKSALNKCWEEGAKGKIRLPEDDPEAVGTYLEWMYTSKIDLNPLTNDDMSAKDIEEEFEHLARAYVFGEKAQDNAFCNGVIDAMFARVLGPGGGIERAYPTTKAISIIYDGTPEGSPARKMCVYLGTQYGHSNWIESTEDGEHPDYLRDLTRSLLDSRGDPVGGLRRDKPTTWHKSV